MGRNWVEPDEKLVTNHPWSRRPRSQRRELITWAVVCLSIIVGVYLTVRFYIHYEYDHLPKATPTCYSAEAL
jgi:hypothetical protein